MPDLPIAKWMRPVELQPGSARIKAVAKVAEGFAEGTRPETILGLVETAFLGADNAAHRSVSEAIRITDDTYWSEPHELQARLIAGTVLARVVAEGSELATVASHAIMSATWQGMQAPFEELPEVASGAIAEGARTSRERPRLAPIDSSKMQPRKPALPEAEEFVTSKHGVELLKYVDTAVANAVKHVNSRNRELTSLLRVSDEELNILWWAFSGRSRILGASFSHPTSPARVAIAAGLEFGDLVEFAEEPRLTEELLSRLLGRKVEKVVTLREAIEALAGADFALPDGGADHRFLPVLTCLTALRKHGGESSWTSSAQKVADVLESTHSPVSLAHQTVREILLADKLAG